MIFLSPGIKTRELDYSQYVGMTSSSVVGMVGGGSRGPIGVATLCASPAEFVKTFGEPTIDDYGPMAAISYLRKGSQLYYVRQAGESVKAASVTHDGFLKITAKEKGTYGNNISYELTDVKDKACKISIKQNGLEVESFKTSIDPASTDFVEGLESDYVVFDLLDEAVPEAPKNLVTPEIDKPSAGQTTITEINYLTGDSTVTVVDSTDNKIIIDGPTVTHNAVPIWVPLNNTSEEVYLTGGDDGLPLAPFDIVGTGDAGLQAFRNKDTLDINILCAPGRWEEAVLMEIIDICETRYDCFGILDTPQGLTPQQAISFHNGKLSGENNPEKALSSSYAAIYYPWIKVLNAYTKEKEWNPPSGFICGVFAYNDDQGNPWFAPAGLNRGKISAALAVETELLQGHRDALYGNGNAINPIINYKNEGIVVWGQRTLQRQNSATDRVNVRRLMLQIRKAIAASTAYLVFEQDDTFTWNQFKGLIEPYLSSIKTARGMYDFKVICDNTTNSPADIDNNKMTGKVYIKPTKVAEFIQIDFILTSTGASFDELG